MKRRSWLYLSKPLGLCVVTGLFACSAGGPPPMAVNKPMSAADGAGDYRDSPGGPHAPPIVPTDGRDKKPRVDCPPRCGDDGWEGCGMLRPKKAVCKDCKVRCLGRGTAQEGWYDCGGILIVESKCS